MSDVNAPMMVIRKFLSADQVAPAGTRWGPECDCIQQTVDGGTTWVQNDGLDPRKSDAFRLPPLTGEDAKCLAAGNITDKIKSVLDILFASIAAFQAATAVLDVILLFLPGAGILIDLILAGAQALFLIGVEALEAAMTDEVYDQFLCIVYCHIGDDGQMSQAQYISIYDQVESDIGGLAFVALAYAMNALQAVGMSNAGTQGESERECDACDCSWCHTFDFALDDGGFVACDWFGQGDKGEYIAACCWQGVLDAAEGHNVLCISLEIDIPDGSQLTSMDGTGEFGSFTRLTWDGVDYDSTFPVTISNTVAAGTHELLIYTNTFAPSLTRWYTIILCGSGNDPFA